MEMVVLKEEGYAHRSLNTGGMAHHAETHGDRPGSGRRQKGRAEHGPKPLLGFPQEGMEEAG